MADERRVTQLKGMVEIEPEEFVRVTQVKAMTEITPAELLRVTKLMAMVEVGPTNPATPYRNKTDGPFLQVV